MMDEQTVPEDNNKYVIVQYLNQSDLTCEILCFDQYMTFYLAKCKWRSINI